MVHVLRACVLIVIGVFPLYAPIYEVQDIGQLVSYLANHDPQEILVIFDVDNTLLIPDHSAQLGSDQWFEQYIAYLITYEQLTYAQALARVLPEYIALQLHISTRPVQSTTVALLNHLRQSGVPVIFLTVRSHELAPITRHELMRHGMIPYTECPAAHTHHHFFCLDTILFTQGGSKGLALIAYLQMTNRPLPQMIIMVDDKLKHLESVEKACHDLDIPFIGLRYGYLDDIVAQFRFDPHDHVPKTYPMRST